MLSVQQKPAPFVISFYVFCKKTDKKQVNPPRMQQLKSAFWGVSKTTPDANWAATMGIKAFIDCIVKQ